MTEPIIKKTVDLKKAVDDIAPEMDPKNRAKMQEAMSEIMKLMLGAVQKVPGKKAE